MSVESVSNAAPASLSLADSFFVDADYQSAVDSYSAALSQPLGELDTDDAKLVRFRALSHRAAAFLNLGKPSEALEDSVAALELSVGVFPRLRTGEEEACQMRAGQAAFQLNRLDEAKGAFDRAMQLAVAADRDAESCRSWLKKCEKDAETSPRPKRAATAPPHTPTGKSSPTTKSPAGKSPAGKSGRPSMPKYQYYQNDTFMTVSILEPNVQPEDLKVDFGLDKLTVILTKGGIDFTVICGTLFDAVDVSKCKVKITDEKVLIKLRKLEKHEWHELFGLGAQDKDQGEIGTKAEAPTDTVDEEAGVKTEAPMVDKSKTRPYSSHKDWDAIERDLKKQEEAEKPEGEEALNKLFQDIYGKANEDTRRAMVKSFQTSGGTVLSTNWNEVSNTDYEKERQAPKGMEWKDSEGRRLPQKDS